MWIFTAAFSLFLVFNVLGNLPFFIAILKKYSVKRQKMILLREMIIALFILFAFGFFGDEVLYFLGISEGIIGISGGILLLIISLTMIFPKPHSEAGLPEHEPLIVPIAIPTMAGPGSIATVMLFSKQLEGSWLIALIIFLAWLPSLAIVLAASNIKSLIGERGLVAFERLGGLLISLIAVQMITSGSVKLVREHFDVPPPIIKTESRSHLPSLGKVDLEPGQGLFTNFF